MPSKISVTALLALTFAIVGYAQQPTLEDPLLNHLVGHWTLTGTIRGQQTTHDVDASWVLNHQYIQLREVSRDVVTLSFGFALLLVWAGFVESFLSQYHEPVIPYAAKIAFGAIELALLVLYLSKSGR